MAGTIKLDPQLSLEISEALTRLCDNEMQETAQEMYAAVRTLGDDNNIVEQFKEKFEHFQANYNDEMVSSFTAVKNFFEQFTDIATAISKAQTDTTSKVGATERPDIESDNLSALEQF